MRTRKPFPPVREKAFLCTRRPVAGGTCPARRSSSQTRSAISRASGMAASWTRGWGGMTTRLEGTAGRVARRDEIVAFLDEYLEADAYHDALPVGLQVTGA